MDPPCGGARCLRDFAKTAFPVWKRRKQGDRMSGDADKLGDRVPRQAPSERRASVPCCVEVAERIGTVLYMMLVVAGRRGSDGGH